MTSAHLSAAIRYAIYAGRLRHLARRTGALDVRAADHFSRRSAEELARACPPKEGEPA